MYVIGIIYKKCAADSNSMQQSPSSEANKSSASQDIPRIYGTRRFINTFTTASQLSLSSARSIQSIPPHPTSWRSILILSSHLRLGLSSGLFPWRLPTKTRFASLLSHTRATFPTHLILLHLSLKWYLVRRAVHEAPRYVVFSIRLYLVLLRPCTWHISPKSRSCLMMDLLLNIPE